jgi:YidC/Oxa1 family membrane protein insertase
MDIKRNILIIALAVVSYLLLLAWNRDYPMQGAPAAAVTPAPQLPGTVTTAPRDDLPAVGATTGTSAAPNPPAAAGSTVITVSTPSQIATIDLTGGDIIGLSLPTFPVALELPDQPFSLLSDTDSLQYIAQSGLIGQNGPDANSAGRPVYKSEQSSYSIETGAIDVDLKTEVNGVSITKRFSFNADDFLVRIQYIIDNKAATPWRGNLFGQLKRTGAEDPSQGTGLGISTYLGAVMNTPEDPYLRVDFDDMDDGVDDVTMTGGWIGFSQHYFLSSWIPAEAQEHTYSTRKNSSGEYLMGFVSAESVVPAGQTATLETSFWAGPKDQFRLEEISPDLGLAIDYGKLWFIAYPLFWLLTKINDMVGNYGVAIILLTLLIRTVFYPLSVKQFRSQANMRRLQPKLQQLKEKYGDDKQKFMQAQMELWKKENVNPFSGCLPPLLQMPFFLGIFWVLRESVEVRQAPFMLWYQDLSAPDAYFILPLLLGAAYFLQQHMTPMMTSDPMQAKVMKFMPVMFTVFFLWFPTGLVLYSLVNAVTGIVQQWYFNLKVDRETAKTSE